MHPGPRVAADIAQLGDLVEACHGRVHHGLVVGLWCFWLDRVLPGHAGRSNGHRRVDMSLGWRLLHRH